MGRRIVRFTSLSSHSSRAASRRVALVSLIATLASLTASCEPEVFYEVTPRVAGDRTPLTAECEMLDDTRCLLPYPSSTFMTVDPSTATGLRLQISPDSINRADELGPFFEADGFSRVTSIMAGFESELDVSTAGGPLGGAIRLFLAQPGHARYGEEVPLRVEIVNDTRRGVTGLVVGDPLAMLEPETDYVAVVMDSLHAMDGSELPRSRGAEVALGIDRPRSEEEAALAGYHVPTVAFLGDVEVDPAHVLRVWDFTTRSRDDASRALLSMRDQAIAAIADGSVTVELDQVEFPTEGAIEVIVLGRLVGLPDWVGDDGYLTRGADGLPMVIGTTEAPFRVMIPRGTGDYRSVMYGHGAAGSVTDDAFDERLAGAGIGKVNVQFEGWTEDTLLDNLVEVATHLIVGARRLLSPLAQAAAHAVAIDHAVLGVIGDAVSADTLMGMPNPAAGRRPGAEFPIWVGGSLGGTMGLVITSIDPMLSHAVLNVPGAAWAQWVPDSLFFGYFEAALRNINGGDANVTIVAAMSQTLFDMVDGASFVEQARADGDVFLVQESIGDEVLPNDGNEFVAIATGATMIGAPLRPIYGLDQASEVRGASGVTQYQVDNTDVYDVHGFAARQGTTAGQAAFEQIEAFLASCWAGDPVITVPSLCPAMSCDFRSE